MHRVPPWKEFSSAHRTWRRLRSGLALATGCGRRASWVALVLGGFLVAGGGGLNLQGADNARIETLARLVKDESPRVRAEALRALAKIPTAQSAELALSVLDRPMDPNLDYALWLTINDLSEPWIAALTRGEWKPEGRERQLEFAVKALKPEQVSRVLGAVLGDRPLPKDGAGPWIEVIGSAGSAQHLQRLLDQGLAGGLDGPATARALKALGEAARLRKVRPAGDLSVIARFFDNADLGTRVEAMRLAGLWKDVGSALPGLMAKVGALPESAAQERAAGFEALRQVGGDAVVQQLGGWVSSGRDAGLRRSAAISLAALDGTKGYPAVVAAAGTLGDEPAALEYWRAVLGIKGSGLPLREALAGHKLPETVARAGMRVAREGGRDDIELVTTFATAGGLAADTQKLTAELIKDLAGRAMAKGDPQRGERIYRRADLACTTCHAIGGAGGKVGPDMTSIGASAPPDYLVEALLLPNAKIKEGYHSLVVETKDGEEYTGTVARETQEEIFLRNASGAEVAVAKSSIQRREIGRLSLMPSGLMEPLSEQERLDLVAFLSRLGKPGEFDASKGGVARVWHFGNIVHTDLQNNESDWIWKLPLTEKRWVPVTSLVRGDISADLMEAASKASPWTSKVALVAVTEIQQASAGTVRFRLNTADAEVWVAGKRLGSGKEVSGEVPAGRHRVIVRMDPRRLPESLRLDGEGVSFVLN